MSYPYGQKTQTCYWGLQGPVWPGWLCVCHFPFSFLRSSQVFFLSNSLKFTGSFQPQILQTSSFFLWDHPWSPSSRHLLLSLHIPLGLHFLGKSVLWHLDKHPFTCYMLPWHPELLLNKHYQLITCSVLVTPVGYESGEHIYFTHFCVPSAKHNGWLFKISTVVH